MKISILAFVGLAAAGTIPKQRRQSDSNKVDLEKACKEYDNTMTRSKCAVMATYSIETDVFAALAGDFGLNSGDRLIHTFDSDCNHLSTEEVEPNGGFNGFSASISTHDDEQDVEVKIPCYDTACGNGVFIGKPELSGNAIPQEGMYSCGDQVDWNEGIGRYAYRMCDWLCEN